MQNLSPSVNRIGAALRALRRTHEQDVESEDKISLGVKCLHAVIDQLTEDGVPQQDLQPLIDLEALLGQLKAQKRDFLERRRQRPPSDVLLARASAVIDLLIKAGNDESEAAQIVMRRLIAAGVPPPEQGGDARGWKRLLEWRSGLQYGAVSKEAQEEYRDFTGEIEAIPPGERVKRVLDLQLWDRRRKQR